MASAASLERLISRSGHTEQQLRMEIARGERDDKSLCRIYGLTANMLKRFIQDNTDAIAAIAERLTSGNPVGMAGLWIADKSKRVAEMQGDVDDINNTIGFFRDDEGTLDARFGSAKEYTSLINTKMGLLRSVADEIDGNRRAQTVSEEERTVIRYTIGGDDDIAEGLT